LLGCGYRGGLVFKAHRLLCRSTLGLRVTKKRRRIPNFAAAVVEEAAQVVPVRVRPIHLVMTLSPVINTHSAVIDTTSVVIDTLIRHKDIARPW